eukprot:SAG31_NODE_4916_length_2869_cov_3.648375_2_plen_59_part_00
MNLAAMDVEILSSNTLLLSSTKFKYGCTIRLDWCGPLAPSASDRCKLVAVYRTGVPVP